MEKGPVCVLCGKRPTSVYFHLDVRPGVTSFSLGLFGVDLDRLRVDHPDAVGTVCLACLSHYRRHRPGGSPNQEEGCGRCF